MKGIQEFEYSDRVKKLEEELRKIKQLEYKAYRKEYFRKYQREHAHHKEKTEARLLREARVKEKLEQMALQDDEKVYIAKKLYMQDYQREYYNKIRKYKRK